MAKYFSFSPLTITPEVKETLLPEDIQYDIPRAISVWGDGDKVKGAKNHFHAAAIVLNKALSKDPKLEKDHLEFLSPSDKAQRKNTDEIDDIDSNL